jgi:acetylornithine/succinyldiaminopimelate/putrescine aminotransferase
MPIPDPDFYVSAIDICRNAGALLIVDEIQTGLGRTGTFWACEQYGIVPDILVIGKGLSGGVYPVSATCLRPDLQSVFQADPFIHISTFGGAEIGCDAAMAVLELSSRPAFLQHVGELADFFKNAFVSLKKKHSEILVGLRQLGLMMGIEMVNEMCGPVLSKTLFENGVLSVYANNDTRVSQLLPPLIIEFDLAEEIMQRVDRALDAAKRLLEL